MKSRFTKLTGLTALLAIAGLASGSTAWASRPPGTDVFNHYYSDASHTHLVGERHYHCDGSLDAWGQITEYNVFTSASCPPTP